MRSILALTSSSRRFPKNESLSDDLFEGISSIAKSLSTSRKFLYPSPNLVRLAFFSEIVSFTSEIETWSMPLVTVSRMKNSKSRHFDKEVGPPHAFLLKNSIKFSLYPYQDAVQLWSFWMTSFINSHHFPFSIAPHLQHSNFFDNFTPYKTVKQSFTGSC